MSLEPLQRHIRVDQKELDLGKVLEGMGSTQSLSPFPDLLLGLTERLVNADVLLPDPPERL